MKDGDPEPLLPEYVMLFHPPLTLHNLLPFDAVFSLSDAASPSAQGPTFSVAAGGCVEVYQFDLTRKIRLAIQMQVKPRRKPAWCGLRRGPRTSPLTHSMSSLTV
jgi:hypothetical protein